ncbi:MAG: ferredoxin [Gordonia sp. (in: high G+C Gram-positive bacteria)]|uniref:ferredoxin n=1 Tax=Gordonia TaxID=2053 RepID=UPI003266145F
MTARVSADLTKCEGYANCVVAEPEFFDLDDSGKVHLLRIDVADDRLAAVREAVASCPAGALRLEEG